MKIYLVGGAIRDKLLNRPVFEKDWVVVGGSQQEMLKQGFKSVGKFFPVFLHPKTKEEYALARTEKKTGHGYHGFEFNTQKTVTLEEDLKRRDLTINAIAEDTNGNLIDPYGGKQDLEKRYLRHVSESFIEDPVRVLRLARFKAQLAKFNFSIHANTIKLVQQMVKNGELDYLTPERIWHELKLALLSDAPEQFFLALEETRAISIIFPEILVQQDTKEKEEAHFDLLLKKLKQASNVSEKLEIRLAVATHLIGIDKNTQQANPKAIAAFCQRLRIPKHLEKFATHVGKHYQAISQQNLSSKQLVQVFYNIRAYNNPQAINLWLLACQLCSGMDKKRVEAIKMAYEQSKQVTTEGLSNLTGKEIGEELFRRRVMVVDQLSLFG